MDSAVEFLSLTVDEAQYRPSWLSVSTQTKNVQQTFNPFRGGSCPATNDKDIPLGLPLTIHATNT